VVMFRHGEEKFYQDFIDINGGPIHLFITTNKFSTLNRCQGFQL
jgi:hypothetical protein